MKAALTGSSKDNKNGQIREKFLRKRWLSTAGVDEEFGE